MLDDIRTTERSTPRDMRHPWRVPWILGLYSLAGATFILATRWAGWYGGSGSDSQFLLLPFAAILGGITQLLCAMWAFETSDALASAMLGVWGSFWIGYGILNGLFVMGKLAAPAGAFPELGYWFITLAAITWMGAVAAMAEDAALVLTLAFLAAGSTIVAIGHLAGLSGLMLTASWLFIISAVFGWYTATGMMFEATFGRPLLPLGHRQGMAEAPRRGAGADEPGSVLGQTPAARRVG